MFENAEVFITAVAKITDEEIENQSTFEYGGSKYKKLLDWKDFEVLLGENQKCFPGSFKTHFT